MIQVGGKILIILVLRQQTLINRFRLLSKFGGGGGSRIISQTYCLCFKIRYSIFMNTPKNAPKFLDLFHSYILYLSSRRSQQV